MAAHRDRSTRRLSAVLVAMLSTGLALTVVSCTSSTSAARSTPTRVPTRTTQATQAGTTGPFAVGRRTITFVDRGRPTQANGSEAAKLDRTLRTIIEYPAVGDTDRELRDAPPRPGKYPIVVFVHGFGAHADNPYLHPVAAAGFIAVAPAFPLTNADTPGGPNRGDVVNEPGDVAFVLTQLGRLPARDIDLQRVADRSSVGVMGQSVGAAVALSIGFSKQYNDSRIKAVVSSANSCLPPVCPFDSAPVPLLVMHGTADPAAPYRLDVKDYALAHKPKFLLTLIGAKHIQFGDPWDPIAEKVAVDFFRRYLEGNVDALASLQKHANVSGESSLKSST
jgi:fermentation-respiration switch protein FrsA (DUF1100 family)